MPFNDAFTYDIESYPNVFTLAVERNDTGQIGVFEISDRRNDWQLLANFINWVKHNKSIMIGFNNIGYDYPVLHYVLNYGCEITSHHAYNKTSQIIGASHDEKFAHTIWDKDMIVRQLDLFRVHHFDNKAKYTSLKMLEFNMRSKMIQDLPYKPGSYLNSEQIDHLIKYNIKDVRETKAFFDESLSEIKFRVELSEKYGKDMLNFNDTKIGKDYFITRIEEAAPGSCYVNRKPRQTIRPTIAINDVIFPYVRFEHPEFNRVLTWLRAQVITETKGVFDGLSATVNGFQFVFGTGGIHGSIERARVVATESHELIDIDVTSFYPSLAISNRAYPLHLGEIFCDIYQDVKTQRIGYNKKTHPSENKMLKLSLNGVYGDSNNQYSPFYDPQYTMTITINGQLLLCMLAEQLMKIPDLTMIQINTDGMTALCPRNMLDHFRSVCRWWEKVTRLDLEEATYKSMWIRDVNNYIAQYTDPTADLKRKGAYEYELEWYKNHSSLVIQKSVEAYLLHGVPIEQFIHNWPDIMDFMLRTKVPRSSRLVLRTPHGDTQIQNVTRYYISKTGGTLVKIMPPLKKNPTKEREIGINVGRLVTECNDMGNITSFDIDYEWYISEAYKMVM